MEPADLGTSALVDGAVVTAGRDVLVNAVDVIDVAMDTSWTFNFSDSILALSQDRGSLGLTGAAEAGIVGGADVHGQRHVLVTGNVNTMSQIMAGTAMTNESDRALASIEGPGTQVTNGTGRIDVLAHLDADSLYAAVIPYSSGKVGVAADAIDMKDSTVITGNFVDAHIVGAEVVSVTTVKVEAVDDSRIWAIADAVSIEQESGGKSGGSSDGPEFISVGFTQATAEVADVVLAYVVDATVTAQSGDVTVDALVDVNVVTVSIGLGIAESQFGGAGSLISNSMASRVEALVGGTSEVTAQGSVLITATDESDLISFGGGANLQSQFSVGAAIGINEIANTTRAAITGGTVTAQSGEVLVRARAVPVITVITIGLAQAENHDEISTNQGGFGGTLKFIALKLVEFYTSLGFGMDTGGTSIAGSFSVNSIHSKVEAFVAGGAHVTSPVQVRLLAEDGPTVVAVGGALSISDGSGKGASVSINDIGDEVHAWADGPGTLLEAPVVEIHADNNADIDAFSLGGEKAEDFALGGSVTKNGMDNTLDARLANGAAISAGSATVHATDDATVVTVAGNVGFSDDGVAFGAAISLNDQSEEVRATVAGGTITAGTIEVAARADADITGIAVGAALAETFSLGGSVVRNTSRNVVETTVSDGAALTASGGTILVIAWDDSDVIADAGNVSLIVKSEEEGGKSAGGAVGASIAWNDVQNQVRTVVDGAQLTAGTVDVTAESIAWIHALAIAGSGEYAGSSSEGGFGFVGAGAVAINNVANTVEVLVRNGASITATTLSVLAKDDTFVRADGGSGALSLSVGDESGGGKIVVGVGVAKNNVSQTVRAIVAAGAPGAAGPAIVAPTATIEATNDSEVRALAIGIGGTLQFGDSGGASFSGAGAGAGNNVSNQTRSAVEGGSVTANAQLSIKAHDRSLIVSDGGGVDFAFSRGPPQFAFGASVAVNDIDNSTLAELVEPVALHAGDVEVLADTDAEINVFTFVVSAELGIASGSDNAFGLAGAGAGSGNKILNAVEARVIDVDGTTDWITGNLTVHAEDRLRIRSDAGTVAASISLCESGSCTSVEVGAAAATNRIAGSVLATIQDSDLVVGGDIVVKAVSNPSIGTFAFGLSAGASSSSSGSAFSFAGAGSGSGNQIGDVDGHPSLTVAKVVDSTLDAGGDIEIIARDDTRIVASGGAAAISLAFGEGTSIAGSLGASVARNRINKTVRALLEGSTVTGAQSLTVRADSTTQSSALAIAGAGGVGVSSGGLAIGAAGAGGVTINEVDATIEAIVEDSDVTVSGDVLVSASEAGRELFTVTGGAADDLADALTDLAVVDLDIKPHDDDGNPLPDPVNETLVDLADDAASVAAMVGAFGGEGYLLLGGIVLVLDVEDADGPGGADPIATRWLVRDSLSGTFIVVRDGSTLRVVRPAAVVADAGGLALSIVIGESTTVAAAAGAGVALNDVANHVTAAIRNSGTPGNPGVSVGGNVEVIAESLVTIDTQAVGIAIGVAGGGGFSVSFSGAGSVTLNDIDNVTTAEIVNSVVDASGAVDVSADDTSTIRSDAGAAAFAIAGGSSGGLGGAFGAAVADGLISNVTTARIVDSTIGTTSDRVQSVGVLANSSSAITSRASSAAIGVGAGGGPGIGISIAGSFSLNTIDNQLVAAITGSSVAAAGSVVVEATDGALIFSDAGTGSLSVGAGSGPGVGVAGAGAWSINDITNTTRAEIAASVVDANGSVRVEAITNGAIDSRAIGISGAIGAGSAGVGVAGAGSAAENRIGGSTTARIHGAAKVRANGAVTVRAENSATIYSDAGGYAISVGAGSVGVSGAVGLSFSTIRITSSVTAAIDDSEVRAGGAVLVEADATALIDSSSVGGAFGVAGGSVAVTAAAGGAWSDNVIEKVIEARITDSRPVGSGTQLVRGASVAVRSVDSSTIFANATGAAVSVAGGAIPVAASIAWVIAENLIGGSTTARITNSEVRSTTGEVRVETVRDALIFATPKAVAIAVAGGIGGAVGGSGTRGVNTIGGDSWARIDGASLVVAATSITVAADDDGTMFAVMESTAVVGGLGGASVGVVKSENSIVGSVTATVSGGSSLTAANGGIRVAADSVPTMDTQMVSVAATIAIGAGVSVATAKEAVTRSVEAGVDGGSLTATGHAVEVEATSTIDAAPRAIVVAGAVLAIAVASSVTDIGGSTSAYLRNGVTVEAAGVDVTAADVIDVSPTITSVGAGGLAVTTVNVEAGVSRTTAAYLGSGTIDAGNAPIDVVAWSDIDDEIDGIAISFAGISISVVDATATISGSTIARIDAAGERHRRQRARSAP